jgi:hypothetical protein
MAVVRVRAAIRLVERTMAQATDWYGMYVQYHGTSRNCVPNAVNRSKAVSATLPRPCVDRNDGGLSHKSVCLVAGARYNRGERRMSSIIIRGDTFRGISVESRGVFTNDRYGYTYAGQCKDGYACGLGVVTLSSGSKFYADYGPDGWFDGRYLGRNSDGGTIYILFERGEQKEWAHVYADGNGKYNVVACTPDDPRLLALIAQVAPVEVRPADPAPCPPSARHSPPSNRPMDRPGSFCPPQALAKSTATEVHPRTPLLVAVRHNPTAAAPVRFGRPRKPWPTCHCAWRCACTAATELGGVL